MSFSKVTTERNHDSLLAVGDSRYLVPQFWNCGEFWCHTLVVSIGDLLVIIYVIPESDEGA
ncbi:hypothetical protein AB4278_14430 [Vibrio splendidus]